MESSGVVVKQSGRVERLAAAVILHTNRCVLGGVAVRRVVVLPACRKTIRVIALVVLIVYIVYSGAE